jgi:ethanolamine ammonia-lyase large subunit
MPASRATHTGFPMYHATIGQRRYVFRDLKALLGKASPLRSGDQLAGIAAESGEERVAAHYALADLPLTEFLQQHVVPYEADEVTRLIVDTHDRAAFAPIAHLTVGGFRDWLLADETTPAVVSALAPGVTPEMAAAVSKISRLQDLIVMAAKCTVVTAFRTTVGLPGRLSVRLQPNPPYPPPPSSEAINIIPLFFGFTRTSPPVSSTRLLPKRRSRVTLRVTLASLVERKRGEVPSFGAAGNSVTERRQDAPAWRRRLPVFAS